jgi:hypothetical protein
LRGLSAASNAYTLLVRPETHTGHPSVPRRKLRTVSLSEAAQAVDSKQPGPKCGVYALRQKLSPEDLKVFDAWLHGDRTSTWISEVLKADGHTTSDFTIARHRRGKCSCGTV